MIGLALALGTAALAVPPAQQQARPAPGNEEVSPLSVEQNPQLFAVLCAAHAGGYEQGIPEENLPPLEAAIRREIAKQHGPAVDALRQFYRNHELGGSGETISRYVSFGLVAGPPPNFSFNISQENVPPDAASLEGLSALVSAYYTEQHIDQLYSRVRPIYERHAAELERILGQLTLLETGYIRKIMQPSSEHTFTVYTEALVGNRTNFRIYGGRYALVIYPTGNAVRDDIRHSLLHYLLDPLALAYHPSMAGRKAILDVAARAPRLPLQFRNNVESLADECLVKAVEIRIQRLSPAQEQTQLASAEAEGFILIRPIYNGLLVYEKSEDSLSTYYAALIQKLDLNAEAKRLATFQFAAADPSSPTPVAETAEAPRQQISELDRWLIEGESQLANKDTKLARATFERILEKYPDVPRAQFGLAVSIIVEGEVDRSRALLERVVAELTDPGSVAQTAPLGADPSAAAPTSFHPDPRTLAWAHIWLARICEEGGQKRQAEVEYRAALAVAGAPEGARLAAQRGLAATNASHKSP